MRTANLTWLDGASSSPTQWQSQVTAVNSTYWPLPAEAAPAEVSSSSCGSCCCGRASTVSMLARSTWLLPGTTWLGFGLGLGSGLGLRLG